MSGVEEPVSEETAEQEDGFLEEIAHPLAKTGYVVDTDERVSLSLTLINASGSQSTCSLWRQTVDRIKLHVTVEDHPRPYAAPVPGARVAFVTFPVRIISRLRSDCLVFGQDLGGRRPELSELVRTTPTGLIRVSACSQGYRHYRVQPRLPMELLMEERGEATETASSTGGASSSRSTPQT
jgi:hypothetical protein